MWPFVCSSSVECGEWSWSAALSSRRSSIISLLSSRRGPNLARLHRPAPPRHVHGIVGTLIVCWYPATLKYIIIHPTPNISLASGHLALCAIGRTFYFRNIVFHLSTRPPKSQESCTNQYCLLHIPRWPSNVNISFCMDNVL